MSISRTQTTRSHSARPGRLRSTVLATGALTALLVVAAPLAASAHVSLEPGEAPTGGSTVLTFSVGHGCDGSATTALVFDIPEEVAGLKPTAKAGWDIAVTEETITYTAQTPLADGIRDTVELQVSLDDAAPAGTTIAFPVTQLCEVGETAWVEIAAEGEDAHALDAPAPTLTVTEAVADSGHGDHGAEATDETDATAAVAPSTDVIALVVAIGALVLAAAALIAALAAVVRQRGARG